MKMSLNRSLPSFARQASRCLYHGRHSRQRFHTQQMARAAQNFTMPAMSPTMTEGTIANWRVKEGDSFSSGDVLLEIETDKAQMDVEAQDDGKMTKIVQQAGAKGVKVGARIAVIAEPEDDLTTISIPKDEAASSSQSQPNKEQGQPRDAKSSDHKSGGDRPAQDTTKRKQNASGQKQSYPLYPSIVQLLHRNNIPLAEADNIPASGPKGRLLKGDVLAYLGSVQSDYPAEQASRLAKLQALDLSSAKPAPRPSPSTPATQESAREEPEFPQFSEVSVTISLSKVLNVQKRVQDTLGIHLPLSTFVARATELANEDLPRGHGSQPSADELFDDIIGLASVESAGSRGDFFPYIADPSTLTETPVAPSFDAQEDIYDTLTAPTSTRAPRPTIPVASAMSAGDSTNLFSVEAVPGDEQRARIFLERMKTMLQVEPGRLIM